MSNIRRRVMGGHGGEPDIEPVNGFGYVDLGLPSGLLWAQGNIVPDGNGGYIIGEETDYGAYVSWGNTDPHFSANGSTIDGGYSFGSSNTSSPYKNSDGAKISYTSQHKNADYAPNSGNDAARELLGGSWRMPTATEFKELNDNCTSAWVTKSGVNGCEFTSEINGAKIFFPAAGNGNRTSLNNSSSYGFYWSSSLHSADDGYHLRFKSSSVNPQSNDHRYFGFSVRAVTSTPPPKVIFKVTTTDGSSVEGVELTISNQSKSYTVETDATGRVALAGLSGAYIITSATHKLNTSSFTVNGDMTVNVSARKYKVYNYSYKSYARSVTLEAGKYKLECWGAQGGKADNAIGGKGGYASGIITLNTDTTLYVLTGGQGGEADYTAQGITAGGTNGGGACYDTLWGTGSGGGASDIRIGKNSLYARVIVAGGGGGACYNLDEEIDFAGGVGGGTTGGDAENSTNYNGGRGGKQSSGGSSYYGYRNSNSSKYGTLATFGSGGGATSGNTYKPISGAGGGWYGGGYSYFSGAGGGSGYVYTAETASNYPSGCQLNSSHYLTDASTVAGDTSFPSTGGGTETGHEGNGYVRITEVG